MIAFLSFGHGAFDGHFAHVVQRCVGHTDRITSHGIFAVRRSDVCRQVALGVHLQTPRKNTGCRRKHLAEPNRTVDFQGGVALQRYASAK